MTKSNISSILGASLSGSVCMSFEVANICVREVEYHKSSKVCPLYSMAFQLTPKNKVNQPLVIFFSLFVGGVIQPRMLLIKCTKALGKYSKLMVRPLFMLSLTPNQLGVEYVLAPSLQLICQDMISTYILNTSQERRNRGDEEDTLGFQLLCLIPLMVRLRFSFSG